MTVRCQWVDRAERGAIEALESEAAALRVAVLDTGIGIADNEQAAVWEEFQQNLAAAQLTGAMPGTGLGLSLTRKLVKHMGGVVWLESKEGEGSTFTFILPRKPPAAIHQPLSTSPSETTATDNGLRTADSGQQASDRPLALIIEDYPAVHKLLVDWLSEAGLATASAFDGETGLKQARQLHPRLIILDLRLPQLDGWQVLTAL